MLETADFLTYCVSRKLPIDVILLDFAKAFDKVPHKRLLLKLEAYGIEGKVLNWIKAFLSNRTQRVMLGDILSDWEKVTSGVPQGSVLGPLLFIIFINDLPDILSSSTNCKMYADDTKLLSVVNTEADRLRLQADLDSIVNWTRTWLMELNVKKCKVMHINESNLEPSSYFMDEISINSDTNRLVLETSLSERDLGVQVSANLKYEDQVRIVANKANEMLGILKHTFVSRETQLWKKLYTTYIRPHLEFAIAAWNPHLEKDILLLENVQRRATKVPQEMKSFEYETRCSKLGITTLRERRVRGDLIQKFKFEKGLEVIDWYKQPLSIPPRAGHRTRFHREIDNNCLVRFNFFNNRIVSAWNALPDDVVESDGINAFKANLDKHSYHSSSSSVFIRVNPVNC